MKNSFTFSVQLTILKALCQLEVMQAQHGLLSPLSLDFFIDVVEIMKTVSRD